MITPAQSRAGRALVEWSQEQLAEAAHLGLSTIRDFEKGRRIPTHNNLLGVKSALESAGVIFVDENGEGPGVRLRRRSAHKMTTDQFKMEGDDFEHNRLPDLLRELKADRMTIRRTVDRMSLHVGTREIGYVELNGGIPKIDPPLTESPKQQLPNFVDRVDLENWATAAWHRHQGIKLPLIRPM
jgi:transcriptional regulator with XRE-family HTH domain